MKRKKSTQVKAAAASTIPPPSVASWKRPLAIYLIALTVRLFYLWESSNSPFFLTPLSDSSTYHGLATELLSGKLDWRFFFQGVFYPLFLSLVYAVAGPSVLVVKVLQAFVGAGTAALTERLGSRIGGPRTGWVSGGITAFYAPVVFLEGELLATCFAVFFAAALVLLFVIVVEKPKPGWFLLLGLLGGMSVLNHAVFLPFFVFSAGWVLFKLRHTNRQVVIRSAAGCLAGFLFVTLPVASANKKITNHFSFLPSSGGLNLYIGNNADTCATLTIRPGEKWQTLVNEPIQHGYVLGADKEAYFTQKFFAYVRQDPVGFIRGLGGKALRFVNGREIPRNLDIYLQHKWSKLLSVGVWKVGRFGFPFALLFAFAATGLVFRNGAKLPMPLTLFISLYTLSIIAVFVTARYRMPTTPAMAVLAAMGLNALTKALRSRSLSEISKVSAVFLLSLSVSIGPGAFCEENLELESELYFLAGTHSVQQHKIDDAITHFQTSTTLNPGRFEAFELLGLAQAEKGRLKEAATALQAAVRLNPSSPAALFHLGKVSAQLGRYSEAEVHLRRLLSQQPNHGPSRAYLGICLANQGKTAEAYEQLKQAVRLMPGDKLAKQSLMKVEGWLSEETSDSPGNESDNTRPGL